MTNVTINTGAVVLALAAMGVCSSCGGASATQATAARGEQPSRCSPPLRVIDAGPAVAGVKLVHREALCSSRPPYTFAVYGTCKATSDMGCSPPLQIQTYRACDRSAADYTRAGRRLRPTRTTRIGGVPARFYRGGRLELSTGQLTVVIFGSSKELMVRAATALGPLPPPARASRLRRACGAR